MYSAIEPWVHKVVKWLQLGEYQLLEVTHRMDDLSNIDMLLLGQLNNERFNAFIKLR
jgi:hypothetical protein